jgi:hypothetical protein
MPCTGKPLAKPSEPPNLVQDMNVKSAIAIMLGLLFQWAQVAQAALSAGDCGKVSASHCECCAGLDSCPCATNGDQESERPQPPILPQSAKLPAAKLCETRVSLEDAPVLQTSGRIHVSPSAESLAGYAGVSLAVAFCSFLM